MAVATRYSIDCTKPSDGRCTLKISGSEDEVMTAAIQHATSKHGYQDTQELHDMLKGAIQVEA